MNTVLNYVIGLDLLHCHAKFRGDTNSRSRENNVNFKVAIFGYFLDILELKLLHLLL